MNDLLFTEFQLYRADGKVILKLDSNGLGVETGQ